MNVSMKFIFSSGNFIVEHFYDKFDMYRGFYFTNAIKSRVNRLNLIPLRCLNNSPLLFKKATHNNKKSLPYNNAFHGRKRVLVEKPLEDVLEPIVVKSLPKKFQPEYVDGLEKLHSSQISSILDEFVRRPMIRKMSSDKGLSEKIFITAFRSFRKMCILDENLDMKIKLYLSDIFNKKASIDILFESFLDHAKKIYPHLDSLEDLKLTSDLTQPHNWYPEARKILRKIYLHIGPTNSGKTHAAIERFKSSKSGVYCAPLRLLAHEIYKKAISVGLECDLVTGEDRRFVFGADNPASHCTCTVEMLSLTNPVEVAVIDEIQLLRDDQRGYAFTRALLGVPAEEVHLCGEVASLDIVKKMLDPIGEHVVVTNYERKAPLTICDYPLQDISKIKKGDAIIFFSVGEIYKFAKQLRKERIQFSIIYGKLPPKTKLEQARKFNDPNDSTKVLLATDAIELIPVYSALQIAGRAGRYGSEFSKGEVMTLDSKYTKILKNILETPIEPIEKSGISPTYEQIEIFSYHLPNASLVNILDIFQSICRVNDTYFLCNFYQTRSLAVLIDAIDLPLKVKYTFCLAPINPEGCMFLLTSFVKIARRYSTNQTISFQWFCDLIKYPFEEIRSERALLNFSSVYELITFYLWMSFHFPDMFPDYIEVKELEKEADKHIQNALKFLLN
ncbi:ATP-dependent RNA helicase SUV3 homolog, mitochondrial [Strongyloides ratti]|uniref:RNA helicase n=1 Tax=Strongyloides ratti TaxID=34506 RepID=A0A090LB74_STRRB|nr:ATP-dependent RNA helicase SUV3 homolog, mitochondrial [Strongyloides ratti]CEF67012.1 ATP-dependent RNA helicase SUV3 homolog, mitochondrial [Strongyloides ratti]